jgi:hypothetical protein
MRCLLLIVGCVELRVPERAFELRGREGRGVERPAAQLGPRDHGSQAVLQGGHQAHASSNGEIEEMLQKTQCQLLLPCTARVDI